MSIKILIADDYKIISDGLSVLIDKEDDMELIGVAENGHKAVELAAELKPDIVIMDVVMPVLNGIEATRQIITRHPDVKVIAFSEYSDRKFVSEMLKAGALGYILKEGSFRELANAIRTVYENQYYICPEVIGVVTKDYISRLNNYNSDNPTVLTGREREVLQQIVKGNEPQDIADSLNLSVNTIYVHRHNIMQKLELFSVSDITKYALSEGIVSI